MITEEALREAIAECQGKRNPNRETCEMLAAFYIIQDHLYGTGKEKVSDGYSYAPEPNVEQAEQVHYSSGSEFSRAIEGKDVDDVMPVIDEAMEAVRVMLPRLYKGVMRRLEE